MYQNEYKQYNIGAEVHTSSSGFMTYENSLKLQILCFDIWCDKSLTPLNMWSADNRWNFFKKNSKHFENCLVFIVIFGFRIVMMITSGRFQPLLCI